MRIDLSNIKKEKKRQFQMLYYESICKEQGIKYVAGIDEAGRGPLAGPVVAAACILPDNFFIPGINDSKKLDESTREKLYQQIISYPELIYKTAFVDNSVIDEINIFRASLLAMKHAVEKLTSSPQYILVDGKHLPPIAIKGRAIIQGDASSLSIAVASILAKHERDQYMRKMHEKLPQYGFDKHKGYATKVHIAALEKNGPSELHRNSFNPVRMSSSFSIQ